MVTGGGTTGSATGAAGTAGAAVSTGAAAEVGAGSGAISTITGAPGSAHRSVCGTQADERLAGRPSDGDEGAASLAGDIGTTCASMTGRTFSFRAGTTTVAATVATMPVVAAAATPTMLAVVAAAAAFMATTRPTWRTPRWRGSATMAAPRLAIRMVATTSGSSTSSSGSAGPRAWWINDPRSEYQPGASGSRRSPVPHPVGGGRVELQQVGPHGVAVDRHGARTSSP